MASMASADAVHVLDNGRVEAFGSHEDLVRASGLYRRILAEQLPG